MSRAQLPTVQEIVELVCANVLQEGPEQMVLYGMLQVLVELVVVVAVVPVILREVLAYVMYGLVDILVTVAMRTFP